MKRILKFLVWPISLAPPAYLWLSWKKIPLSVPMHYNLKGEVDRYGSRNELLWLVIILSVISIGTWLLLLNMHRIDPKKTAASNKDRMPPLAFGISLFMSAFSGMMIYYAAHPGVEFGFNLVLVGVGLLFAFIGNYMHTIKPNYFLGLRLPWTLENEDNWKQTHALAGKLWFAGGILIAIIALLTTTQVAIIIMMTVLAIIVLIPAVFSYRLFKKQRSRV